MYRGSVIITLLIWRTWQSLNRLAYSDVLLVTLCHSPLTRCISDTGVVRVRMIDNWAGRIDVELIVHHHSTVCTNPVQIFINYSLVTRTRTLGGHVGVTWGLWTFCPFDVALSK